MLRAIQEIKPKYVIAENVFGITNLDDGLVFEQVCLDLENEGYEVQPFIIPASAKNAPHQRLRCWFIAYTNGNGFNECNGNDEINTSEGRKYAFYDFNKAFTDFRKFPTQSPICSGDDGLPTKLDGITFSKWRAESIKGYGNAIVPQIALQLFQIIETL